MPEYVTKAQLAGMLGVAQKTINRWVKEGKLPSPTGPYHLPLWGPMEKLAPFIDALRGECRAPAD